MRWELDRATFERLIRLYLLSFMVGFGLVAYEVASPTWSAFSDGFDVLVETHFGRRPPELETAAVILGVTALVWHIASAVGLLWYKRWARFGFWASLLILLLMEFFPLVSPPTFQTPWSGWLTWIGEALFGAIVLLAYSGAHGGVWFMRPLDKLKETF